MSADIGSGMVTCPKCDGIGGHPGFDVDGTAITITCDLCLGCCEVGRLTYLDYLADEFEERAAKARLHVSRRAL